MYLIDNVSNFNMSLIDGSIGCFTEKNTSEKIIKEENIDESITKEEKNTLDSLIFEEEYVAGYGEKQSKKQKIKNYVTGLKIKNSVVPFYAKFKIS